jgi:RNA polymerase sigma factor (sigma-70 family)
MKKSNFAEDAEQEALYLAYTMGIIEQGEEYHKNWVRKVKKNKIANYERSNKKYIFIQDYDSIDSTKQLELIYDSSNKLLNKLSIRQALETLKTEDLAIVNLHYYGGYTLLEVAKELGMTPAQVFKRHERIKQALKKLITPPPKKLIIINMTILCQIFIFEVFIN